ncbi:MerR family transcriptional regulator [Levilactobacillus enshiensis]|uniref:MerR family transcriptional regulator n=1 Tax=Levilactobacillus enshiensis TaxID=2590213 RepID=UPI00117AFFA3|nr:MerR family transcriptional regulator [Levilactobacillus enshiensis]
MAYSVQALAQLAGVSPRTLRYYDQIGLLPADRNPDNGYREYSTAAVDRLQVIRYFQAFDFSLAEIQALLAQPTAAQTTALAQQRVALAAKRDHLTALLTTLDRTLAARQGGPQMTDTEKFTAFKRQQLTANDQQFGAEARQNYGKAAVDASQQRFSQLTEADYQAMQATEKDLLAALKVVTTTGDYASPTAQQVYRLHRQWLCFTWNNYSVAAHQGLAQLYLSDDRFAKYYNQRTGCANATAALVACIQRYAK